MSTAAARCAAGRGHDPVQVRHVLGPIQEGTSLHDPLRIEFDDPERAESLRRALALFHADVVQEDGRAEVRVELIAGNPESRITDALHAIDQWLERTGTSSVRVHLDGQVYTLSAPR